MSNYEHYKPKSKWERDVLAYNPFEGDFGDPSDVTFKDRLILARKQYTCQHCRGTIFQREQHRYIAARFDGNMMTYRYCSACCDAMAGSWKDGGEALDALYGRAMRTNPNTFVL
jgi:hypothetical protein